MSINVGTDQNPALAFLARSSGRIDAMIRATDRATFDAAAVNVGLLDETPEGDLVPAPGVDIDHLGPVVVEPAVLDGDGNVITPATMDNRHHANIRLSESALTALNEQGEPQWKQWAVLWTQEGDNDPNINANEQAKVRAGVSLIDPPTVATPIRVWL